MGPLTWDDDVTSCAIATGLLQGAYGPQMGLLWSLYVMQALRRVAHPDPCPIASGLPAPNSRIPLRLNISPCVARHALIACRAACCAARAMQVHQRARIRCIAFNPMGASAGSGPVRLNLAQMWAVMRATRLTYDMFACASRETGRSGTRSIQLLCCLPAEAGCGIKCCFGVSGQSSAKMSNFGVWASFDTILTALALLQLSLSRFWPHWANIAQFRSALPRFRPN